MKTINDYGISDFFIKQASLYPNLKIARIIAQHKGIYKIITSEGEQYADISGKFRYAVKEIALYPAVGDFVMVSNTTENQLRAVVHSVLLRKSAFQRTAVGVTGQMQIIASNIDIIFICMSFNNDFNLSRLERYLSIAWNSGATPVIILTKADLCENLQEMIKQVESVAQFADIIITSAYDDKTCSKIYSYVKAGITASFIGSSGVGKSTLINKLMGEEILVTAEIGKKDKGRHATTGREMFLLSQGGIVIDTPGMREIGLDSVDLSKSFADIEALETECKFGNCTHISEPGCAILQAISDGSLDERRLANYFKLKRESKYDGLSSKEIETKKFEKMFKEVGGKKNFRNILNKK